MAAVNVEAAGDGASDSESEEFVADARNQNVDKNTDILAQLKIPALKRILSIIVDVETRWNSTFNMLERCLILRRPIQAVMAQHDKSFGESMNLHPDEWNRMEVSLETLLLSR